MPTSRKGNRGKTIEARVVDFCSGAWVELGVSGWGRTHQNWAIDPEPLIIFTSVIGQEDPRLRDEAMDWCIRHWRHVSVTRLKNILREQSEATEDAWGEFAATVNARAGVRWPGATAERSSFRVTGRSTLRSLSEPSLVVLRMRAIFGVGARAEILREFLFDPRSKKSAVDLAELTNYTKRSVAEECDQLVQADLLSVKGVRNRFYYSLTNARALTNFVGAVPPITPDWNALLSVIESIWTRTVTAGVFSPDALIVETHQVVRDIDDDLDVLGVEGPRLLRGSAILSEWDEWSAEFMAGVASGGWPGTEPESIVQIVPSTSRPRRSTGGGG